MNQREYWNGPGAAKNFTTPVRAELLAERLPSSARILDYGCGYGRALRELARAGFSDLVGADHSAALLDRGRLELAGMEPLPELRLVDPGDFPFADESFDAVLLLAVLTCLAGDEDLAGLMAQVRRVLRPGGLLLINDFLVNNDQPSRDRYQNFADKYWNYGVFELPDGGLVRHFQPEYLDRLLAGWELLLREEPEFVSMNGNTRKGITLLLSNR